MADKPVKLTRTDLKIAAMSVASFLKASTPQLKDIKPGALEWKVFAANTDIKAKLELGDKLYDLAPDREDVELTFDRNQLKVLMATLLHTATIQNKVLEEYGTRPEEHPAFSNQDGYRKADYVKRLTDRAAEVKAVVTKLQEAL